MSTTAEVWIPLTQGQVTVVDFDDFEKVRGYKWHAKKVGTNFYAARNAPHGIGKQRTVRLHEEICEPGADHRDGDGLNNRRDNLRAATHQQNMMAFRRPYPHKTSKYRGVGRRPDTQKWRAKLTLSGKTFNLGDFGNEEAAARAYDAAAKKYFGEFAQLNFP